MVFYQSTIPLTIAAQHLLNKNIQESVPSYALGALYVYRNNIGRTYHPDFGSESYLNVVDPRDRDGVADRAHALAFKVASSKYWGAMKWVYRRMFENETAGAVFDCSQPFPVTNAGRKKECPSTCKYLDNNECYYCNSNMTCPFADFYSLMYFPDESVKEEDPSNVWGNTFYDPRTGHVMFRNGHTEGLESVFHVLLRCFFFLLLLLLSSAFSPIVVFPFLLFFLFLLLLLLFFC